MAFFKVGDQIDLLIGSASDEFTGNIRAHITIFKNTDKKFLTVLWIIVNPGVNVLWESKINPAGLQNNLIVETDLLTCEKGASIWFMVHVTLLVFTLFFALLIFEINSESSVLKNFSNACGN